MPDTAKAQKRREDAARRAKALRAEKQQKCKTVQPVRAINEDDDGYDPYSDLHDQKANEPLFERNPWN